MPTRSKNWSTYAFLRFQVWAMPGSLLACRLLPLPKFWDKMAQAQGIQIKLIKVGLEVMIPPIPISLAGKLSTSSHSKCNIHLTQLNQIQWNKPILINFKSCYIHLFKNTLLKRVTTVTWMARDECMGPLWWPFYVILVGSGHGQLHCFL